MHLLPPPPKYSIYRQKIFVTHSLEPRNSRDRRVGPETSFDGALFPLRRNFLHVVTNQRHTLRSENCAQSVCYNVPVDTNPWNPHPKSNDETISRHGSSSNAGWFHYASGAWRPLNCNYHKSSYRYHSNPKAERSYSSQAVCSLCLAVVCRFKIG